MKRSFDTLSAGIQRKRQKLRSARSIASESSSNAIKTGNLPIHEFLSSRRFEIKALTDAIQKSREAGVQRAFQSLPRYLRRRAASHNVKRVPKRARARALAELNEVDLKKQHKRVPFKRKRGRRATMQKLAQLQKKGLQKQVSEPEPVLVTGTELLAVKPVDAGRFVNRQRNKTWLPSHLWTCKRARMETRWNYAIPISPNEKTYRSTHRASTSRGAIIFDTSYTGSILLSGEVTEVSQIVQQLTKSKEPCGVRARSGRKTVDCHIFDNDQALCPAVVLWEAGLTDQASVLITIHPSTYVEVWQLVLELRKQDDLKTVKVIDMRFQIGAIDVFGPLAINTVLSVLKVSEDNPVSEAWKSLHGLLPSEVPKNIAIPLKVKDPRLIFPPRMISESPKASNKYLSDWPQHKLDSPLFSLDQIQLCNASKVKTSELSKSQAANIPVMITRTTLGISIMAPWSYITDIWYSLNHLPLVRFGGLQELSQIYYENCLPFFPNDYPGTRAGDHHAKQLRDERESRYLRKPPAKRTSFPKSVNGKPEVGDPFTSDFEYLLNPQTSASGDLSHVSASLLDRSRTGDTTMDVTMEEAVGNLSAVPLYTSTPQLAQPLPQPELTASLPKQSISQEADIMLPDTPAHRITPILLLISQLSAATEASLDRGIIQVRIRLTQRGCPTTCARIYHCFKEDQVGELIGYLTTGNFSLAEGRATGIGAILAKVCKRVMMAKEEANTSKSGGSGGRGRRVNGKTAVVRLSGACFVRDVGTGNFRKARWETIDQ